MTKTEFIDELKDWCRRAHQIELTIGSWIPLSNDSTMAFMESQHARMFAGDLVRLVILEDKARTTTTYFNPMTHNAQNPKGFDCSGVGTKDTILMLKDRLRALLYEVIDEVYGCEVDYISDWREFVFYVNDFQSSLKRTHQLLGLLLGSLK